MFYIVWDMVDLFGDLARKGYLKSFYGVLVCYTLQNS